jgi:hypothetical protein
MARFHATSEGNVPFTAEEEAEFDAMEAAYAAEQAALARTKYQRDRAAEYPSIGDQLDALWKGGDAATAMLAQVQAVKNKYPKG